MEFRIFRIVKIKDEDEIQTLLETFDVDRLDSIPIEDLALHLAEEYHHEDLEDYRSFDVDEDDLDTEELGYKSDPDADDEGYLIYLTSESVALLYYKRADYL